MDGVCSLITPETMFYIFTYGNVLKNNIIVITFLVNVFFYVKNIVI